MTTTDANSLRSAIRREADDIERAEPGEKICPDDGMSYEAKAVNILDMIEELARAGRPIASMDRAERVAADCLCPPRAAR